jgi:hypothetical protein
MDATPRVKHSLVTTAALLVVWLLGAVVLFGAAPSLSGAVDRAEGRTAPPATPEAPATEPPASEPAASVSLRIRSAPADPPATARWIVDAALGTEEGKAHSSRASEPAGTANRASSRQSTTISFLASTERLSDPQPEPPLPTLACLDVEDTRLGGATIMRWVAPPTLTPMATTADDSAHRPGPEAAVAGAAASLSLRQLQLQPALQQPQLVFLWVERPPAGQPAAFPWSALAGAKPIMRKSDASSPNGTALVGAPTQAPPPAESTEASSPQRSAVAQAPTLAPPMAESTDSPSPQRYRLVQAVAEAPPVAETEGPPTQAASLDDKEKLGEAPPETHAELEFLRRQTVLLKPGDYQFDFTVQYSIDETDTVLAEIDGDVLRIGEVRARQRLLLVPLEFRLGVFEGTQLFVNVPFGWSNSEFDFGGTDTFSNSGGIGDVSAGYTKSIVEGNDICPEILGTFSFSAPTGKSDLVTSLSTPGSTLGEGFWTVSMGLTFIHTYDPMVLFYGFGYRHRFENSFDGISVQPGQQAFYRLGAGFAVNPRMTLSASFIGSYIGADRIEGVKIAGGIREPMQLRFASTIVQGRGEKRHGSVRTVEPFVSFGLTEESIDSVIGVSWTR